MTERWLLSSLHILALGVGLGAVWMRGRALRRVMWDPEALKSAYTSDTLWGLAALLWIGTGLIRLLGGYEKGLDFYLALPAFHAKMGMLGLILLLEVLPMLTLLRWRFAQRRGAQIDTSRAGLIASISTLQALLVIGMVFAATLMAGRA